MLWIDAGPGSLRSAWSLIFGLCRDRSCRKRSHIQFWGGGFWSWPLLGSRPQRGAKHLPHSLKAFERQWRAGCFDGKINRHESVVKTNMLLQGVLSPPASRGRKWDFIWALVKQTYVSLQPGRRASVLSPLPTSFLWKSVRLQLFCLSLGLKHWGRFYNQAFWKSQVCVGHRRRNISRIGFNRVERGSLKKFPHGREDASSLSVFQMFHHKMKLLFL